MSKHHVNRPLSWFILLSLIFSSFSLGHSATHNAGEVLTSSGINLSQLTWPRDGSDRLFSMSFLVGLNNNVTSSFSSSTEVFAEPGPDSSEQTTLNYTGTVNSQSFSVQQRILTYDASYGLRTNAVEIEYKLTNTSSAAMAPLFLGTYFDFDLPSLSTNRFGYDGTRNLFYQHTGADITPSIYVGVRVLSGPTHSAHFRNFGNNFNRSFTSIADGIQDTSTNATTSMDVTFTLSQRYESISPSSTATYTIGIFFGETLSDIQAASDTAFSLHSGAISSLIEGAPPKTPIYGGKARLAGQPADSGGGCLLKP